MTRYDDAPLSCTNCSRGLDADDLCECDDGPVCCRCHVILHAPMMVWRRTA